MSSIDSTTSETRSRGPVTPIRVAVAVGVVATGWALTDLPGPLAPAARPNLVLALALAGVSVGWLGLLLGPRGPRARVAVAVGFTASVVGAVPTLALATARLAWVPDAWAFRALALFALESPLWALCLAVWPARPEVKPGPRLAVRGLALLALGGLLLWLLLVRPAGGVPRSVLGWSALAAWAFVLGGMAVALVRGPRPDVARPFWLLVAALAAVLVGNLLLTLPASPSWTVFVSGMAAALLRLGAAGAMRKG